jgi:regulator of protease activity HflC (stomatin/prohibitin superfamily)
MSRVLNRVTQGFIFNIESGYTGVHQRFGKVIGTKQPGLNFQLPIVDNTVHVFIGDSTLTVPKMHHVSSDHVTFNAGLALQYQIVDPVKSLTGVDNFNSALYDRVKIALREVLSKKTMDEVVQRGSGLTESIAAMMLDTRESWGVVVKRAELMEVEFEDGMKRAMAAKAEADRNAAAKIANAQADIEVAKLNKKAAEEYDENHTSLRLREMDLIARIATKSTVYVVPSTVLDGIRSLAK